MEMCNLKIRRAFLIFFFMVSASIALLGQTGTIEGIATDKKNKETLPGVMVTIDGTTIGAMADPDGHFVIPNIKPGKYRIKASYISYSPMIVEDVVVRENNTTKVGIVLEENAVTLQEVKITGIRKTNTDVSMINVPE